MYGSKNTLIMLPLFKKQKSLTFSNFSYPGSRKVLTWAKIIIFGQKGCRYLTVWSIFVYNLVTIEQQIKKLWKESGRAQWTPQTYLISKKPKSCRVKVTQQSFICSISPIKTWKKKHNVCSKLKITSSKGFKFLLLWWYFY